MEATSCSRPGTKRIACDNRDKCANKRKEACIAIGQLATEAGQNPAEPLAAEIMIKHDYRNIKVAKGMTATIDLEEIKKEMKRSHYPSHFLYGG